MKTRRSPFALCLRLVLAGWMASLPACGGSRAAPADPPPVASREQAADRSGPTAGVPGLVLPDTDAHATMRRGLRARLDFARSGEERPDLLQRIALDHLEEAEEAERAELRVQDHVAEVGAYPEATALAARLAEAARQNRAAAIEVLRAVVAEHPTHEHADAALFTLASALQTAGQRDAAAPVLLQLVREHPGSEYLPDALLDLGDIAFDSADLATAQRFYERVRAHREAPVRPYATYKLGWVKANLGEFREALELLLEVASLPDAPAGTPAAALRREARRDVTFAYAHVGDPAKAPEFFRSRFPEEAPALLFRLGQIWDEQGRIPAARTVWAALLEGAAPCDPERLLLLRLLLETQERQAAHEEVVALAERWAAEVRRLDGCVAPADRDTYEARVREALALLREIREGWRAEQPHAGAPSARLLERLDAAVEAVGSALEAE